ncbi:hypothetical protein B0H14DRAFT_3126527 [Mycena olivaceomarginata]|nr:hypothetical protein B0H14DRAFT_3126527 [Mycena olivaceomarginata]
MANTPDLRREGMERVESDPYYGGGGWHKQLWRVQAKYVGGPEFNTPTIPELRLLADKKAFSIIVKAAPVGKLYIVHDCHSAHDAWHALKNEYEPAMVNRKEWWRYMNPGKSVPSSGLSADKSDYGDSLENSFIIQQKDTFQGNAFQIRDGVATVAGYAGVIPARSVPATGGWWGKERRWKCGTSGDSALAIAGARTVAGRRAMRGMASSITGWVRFMLGARRGVGAVAGRCGNGAGRPKASGSVVVTACGDGRNRVLHRERRYRRGWWREGRWREKWGARAACTADGDLGRTGIGRATTASKTLDYTPMKGAGARTAYGKRHGYVVDGDQWRRVVSGRG